jgi:hypothetical protein
MKRNRFITGLFFAATAFTLAFSSCKKSEDTPSDDTADSQAILVESASVSGEAVFIVNALPSGGTKDSITAADLPAAITTYLNANYSGYTLKKTFKASVNGTVEGYIVVILYNGKPVGLKFDAAGAFVKVCEQRERGDLRGQGWKKGGRFDGRDGKQRDTIAVTALSALIKTYFTVNYPTDTIKHAFKGKDNSTVVISINNGIYATAFNSSDVFVKRAEIIAKKGRKVAVEAAALPAKATTYLTTTFPGYVFDKAFSVNVNGTVVTYVVFINSNNTRYGIEFNAAGDFVKNVVIR